MADISETKPQKPFPWPLGLILLTLLGLMVVLMWAWSQEDYGLILYSLWIAVCSFLPGISVVVIVGSLVQMRLRPFLSSVSLVFGGSILMACIWIFQKIVGNAEGFLK